MRPWLVAIGTVFLLVGGGALVGLVLLSPSSVEQQASEQLVNDLTPPNGFAMFAIQGAAHPSGTLTVRWTSTGPIAAELSAGACAALVPGCTAPVVHNWSSSESGTYAVSGAIGTEYILAWTTSAKVTAVVNATALTDWSVPATTSLVDLTAELASGLLAAVGVVALFLGLFLRGDFRGPPRIVSRSADDAAAVAGATDPRTGTTGDGSGSPRPRPPSRSG